MAYVYDTRCNSIVGRMVGLIHPTLRPTVGPTVKCLYIGLRNTIGCPTCWQTGWPTDCLVFTGF